MGITGNISLIGCGGLFQEQVVRMAYECHHRLHKTIHHIGRWGIPIRHKVMVKSVARLFESPMSILRVAVMGMIDWLGASHYQKEV